MNQLIRFFVIAVFALTLAVPALASVEFTGQVATTLQSLQTKGDGDDAFASLLGEQPGDEEIGFGDARFNLQVHGDVAAGVTGFAEVQNNARTFRNADEFSNLTPVIAGFTSSNLDELGVPDPNQIDLREAYITFHDLFPRAELKLGRADLLYGTQYMDRSVNARVQDNPLVGNHLADFGGPEVGLHVDGQYRQFDWNASVTNGTREATVNEDRGFGVNLGVGFDVFSNGYVKGSYYRVDHGDGEARSRFLVDEGDPYLLDDSTFQQITLPNQGFYFLSQEVKAWQVDGRYEFQDLNMTLSGYFGQVELEDAPLTSAVYTEEGAEADYWNVQGDWSFTPRTGLAARYGVREWVVDSLVAPTIDDVETDRSRLQIGAYHHYRENVLAKLEYVNHNIEIEGGSPTLRAADDYLSFDGVVGELSVAF